MAMLIDEQTAAVNEVRERCVKAAALCEDAAGRVRSARLAAYLDALHRERRRFADALAQALESDLHTLPKAADPEPIALDTLVHNVAALLSGDADASHLAHCRDADREVLRALEDEALKGEPPLPPHLAALLSELRAACERALEGR